MSLIDLARFVLLPACDRNHQRMNRVLYSAWPSLLSSPCSRLFETHASFGFGNFCFRGGISSPHTHTTLRVPKLPLTPTPHHRIMATVIHQHIFRCPKGVAIFRANLSFLTLVLDGRLSEPRCDPASQSEELRLAALHCMDILLASCSPDAAASLQQEEALPLVGHAVHVLLEGVRMLVDAPAPPLRLCEAHLATLAALAQRVDSGLVMASFLPGVSVALAKVLMFSRQNSTVILAALEAWDSVVPSCLADTAFLVPSVSIC